MMDRLGDWLGSEQVVLRVLLVLQLMIALGCLIALVLGVAGMFR